jgi:ABC-type dipeptide/oligopeptide/nickel transport system permease component
MFSYLVRRVLLFVPTIIGATFIVVMLMALAPTDPILEIVRQAEGLPPGVIEQRLAYIQERYGSLNTPAVIKYLRWLNKVSPVGFQTWKYDDPRVVEQRQKKRVWAAEVRPGVEQEVQRALAQRLQEIQSNPDLTEGEKFNRSTALVSSEVQRRMASLEDEQGFWPMPGDINWKQSRYVVKRPDLGDSIVKTRPVWPLIREALPVTLLINMMSLPLALSIALITGIWSAKHRGKWQDWGTGGVLLALYSIPIIWLGVMAIGFLANVQFVKWFPAAELHDIQFRTMRFWPSYDSMAGGWQRGYMFDTLWHLALPVFCLALGQFAYLSKLTRTAVLETLSADYIRTARAKGLSPNTVLLRHGLRNSLIPVITFLAAIIPYIISGSIVVETIFSLNGMGRLTIDAIKAGDIELFLGVTLMILILKLLCYLGADIAYVIADPRVSFTGSGQ